MAIFTAFMPKNVLLQFSALRKNKVSVLTINSETKIPKTMKMEKSYI